MSTTEPHEFRTVPAVVDADGHADPATGAWIQAENQGFHGAKLTQAVLDRRAADMVADGSLLTGAYPTATLPALLRPEAPVATFATFEGSLAVGGPEPVRTHLVSAVTVRPTHRRQGLLRRMMTEDLTRAVQDGYSLAALTVSEATIYRRFGFGLATTVHAVDVTTDSRFRLTVEPTGRCELVDPTVLLDLGPEVFARFHARSPGSVSRQTGSWRRVAGLEDGKGGEDADVRAAVHLDPDGSVDGYVAYRFRGWDSSPATLDVVDLVAADDNAYLGLWQFLASVDLATRVSWHAAPVHDPLRWALSDWRVVTTTGFNDWVWIRVLDPVRAFEARGWVGEGALVLDVEDPLGFAAGRFHLAVGGGAASVSRTDAAADLVLDADALGSLYLGGVDPVLLVAAGQLRELVPGAAVRARALLAPVAPVWGITHF